MSLFSVSRLSRPGLGDISFTLDESELVCLSGPSGAGKTLMLRALVDLDANQGEVYLQDRERAMLSPVSWRQQVGFLPAESRWWAATVGEHFQETQTSVFEHLGFDAGVAGWTVERLSSGERQRLSLARLLANRPRVLLLDEPTANLDPRNTERVEQLVRDYLNEQRAACLWVTHASDQIGRIADRVLSLDAGGLRRQEAA